MNEELHYVIMHEGDIVGNEPQREIPVRMGFHGPEVGRARIKVLEGGNIEVVVSDLDKDVQLMLTGAQDFSLADPDAFNYEPQFGRPINFHSIAPVQNPLNPHTSIHVRTEEEKDG